MTPAPQSGDAGGALPPGVELSHLPGGIRVVTESVDSVRSVALGLWVRAGSRDEAPSQAGLSHFLEHMLFKGTADHSAIEISEIFDGLGASVNAATSKESTHLHARFLDAHTERAFEVLSQMLLGPTYAEIDSEREVVLEEIAMYEDEPQDRVHDVLGEAVFGEHPLGRRVLGQAQVISSVPIPDLGAYHDNHYTGPNIVVGAAGHLQHDEIVSLTERFIAPSPDAPPAVNGGQPPNEPRLGFHVKETEQYHICFGGHGISRGDERRFALSLLDAIFGGSTSSRLFREIREKRGLAYAVGSYTEQYVECGMVAMYVGTREDNVEEACRIIGEELARLGSDGVSADELERAKEHVKGRMVLGLEATAARMSRISRATLFDVPLLSLDEMLARVDAVTLDDLSKLAGELYDPAKLSAACIGPSEERFRNSLPPVSETLAAAA